MPKTTKIKQDPKKEELKISVAAQKRSSNMNADTESMICVHHGGNALSLNNRNYYKANQGSIFAGLGLVPICKKCLISIYMKYYNDNHKDPLKALFFTCRRIDVKFDLKNAASSLKKINESENQSIDAHIGNYMGQMNGFKTGLGNYNFDGSDELRDDATVEAMLKDMAVKGKLSTIDKRNMSDIKKKVGHDPFEGYGYEDYQLAKMYQELVLYLEDDDLVNDSYKMNIILQIININQQIRHYDICLSLVNNNHSASRDNVGESATYISQKTKLSDTVVKIIKENKWITSDTTGKSKLSGKMKRYKDYGYDEIAVDYSKILTSKPVKAVLDASNESIIKTLNFGDDSAKEVIRLQTETNNNLRNENMKLKEQVREIAIELRDEKKENKKG
jgi:hypothetical protein